MPRTGGRDGTKMEAGNFGAHAEVQSWSWWAEHGDMDGVASMRVRENVAVDMVYGSVRCYV